VTRLYNWRLRGKELPTAKLGPQKKEVERGKWRSGWVVSPSAELKNFYGGPNGLHLLEDAKGRRKGVKSRKKKGARSDPRFSGRTLK